jgi:hypothetical protein
MKKIILFLISSSFYINAQDKKANITLGPGGIGIHTLKPSPRETVDIMPRKLDKSGYFVHTPGFSLLYRYEQEQMGGIIIQDSFGNMATGFGWGFYKDLSEHFQIGFVTGLYIRESIEKCHRLSDGDTTCIKRSYDIPVKFQVGGGGSKTDIAPMLAGTFNYFLPLGKQFYLDFSVLTAIYISLVTVGIRLPI